MSDKPLKYQHLNEKYLICSGLLINSDNDQLYRSQQSKACVPVNDLYMRNDTRRMSQYATNAAPSNIFIKSLVTGITCTNYYYLNS